MTVRRRRACPYRHLRSLIYERMLELSIGHGSVMCTHLVVRLTHLPGDALASPRRRPSVMNVPRQKQGSHGPARRSWSGSTVGTSAEEYSHFFFPPTLPMFFIRVFYFGTTVFYMMTLTLTPSVERMPLNRPLAFLIGSRS